MSVTDTNPVPVTQKAETKMLKALNELEVRRKVSNLPLSVEDRMGCVALACDCLFRSICSGCTFCDTATCCANSTIMTISSEDNRLSSKKINKKLTQADFYQELYEIYGTEYLPVVQSVALGAIEKMFPDEYEFWKNFDPKSTEFLDHNKASFFKKTMEEAYEVIREFKKAQMKRDLEESLKPKDTHVSVSDIPLLNSKEDGNSHGSLEEVNLTGPPSNNHPSDRKKDSELSDEFTTPPVDSINPSPPLLVVQKSASVYESAPSSPQKQTNLREREDIEPASPIQEEEILVETSFDLFSVDVDSSPSSQTSDPKEIVIIKDSIKIKEFELKKVIQDVILITDCDETVAESIAQEVKKTLKFPCTYKALLDQIKKIAKINGIKIRTLIACFNHKKIVEDLLLLTTSSKSQAEEIAYAVENNIKCSCSRQDIWEEVKKEIQSRRIAIKKGVSIDLYKSLLVQMDSKGLCKISELPTTELANFMVTRNSPTSSINTLALRSLTKKGSSLVTQEPQPTTTMSYLT